eukprot:NP_741700.1 Uncharacterized protein CELE_Y73B3A.18 [Caenorhabditis elegans]
MAEGPTNFSGHLSCFVFRLFSFVFHRFFPAPHFNRPLTGKTQKAVPQAISAADIIRGPRTTLFFSLLAWRAVPPPLFLSFPLNDFPWPKNRHSFYFWARRPYKMPSKKVIKKKVAAVPAHIRAQTQVQKEVKNPLFEKRARNFNIGQDIQPKKDVTRFVKWPKYIRLQRQSAILQKRLKVPPTINQFRTALDSHSGWYS